MKLRNIDSHDLPKFAEWLKEAMRTIKADAPDLWAEAVRLSEASEIALSSRLRVGAAGPRLLLRGLESGFAHHPAGAADVVDLHHRLASGLDREPENERYAQLTRAALTGAVVDWARAAQGKSKLTRPAAEHLAEAFGGSSVPPWIAEGLVAGDLRVEQTIRLSAVDITDLYRITEAEAGSEPLLGQAAVICVVLNRVASNRFPKNVRKNLDEPGQFEPVGTRGHGSVVNLPMPPSARKAAYAGIIASLRDGTMGDVSNGATFFQNVRITEKRKTRFAGGVAPVMVIGRHSFFDRFKASDPVKPPKWAIVTPDDWTP